MSTRGERLRTYLLDTTGGRSGWQRDLVARSGVKRQTISKWTNPRFDGWPDLETLAAVADALGVPTYAIVAALEDLEPVATPVPPMDEVVAAMREQAAAMRDLADVTRASLEVRIGEGMTERERVADETAPRRAAELAADRAAKSSPRPIRPRPARGA